MIRWRRVLVWIAGLAVVAAGLAWTVTGGPAASSAPALLPANAPASAPAPLPASTTAPRLSRRSAAEPNGRARTGFVTGDIYLQHKVPKGFLESPQRIEAIVNRLKERKLWHRLVLIEPREAPMEWLAAIHDPNYVRRAQAACQQGLAQLDGPDMPIGPRSYDAAVASAGGVLAAIDAVMDGNVDNAFCAVRPPGHHAMKDKAMGFCMFNNVAVGARYVQKKHNLARVLIVDWDVHHGNGTQAAFYDDPSVFYFSTHRSPFYPGTGGEEETGAGKGKGFTLNVPLPAGVGDANVIQAFRDKLVPAAEAFRPDFVLVSAGFDAHQADPLGGMRLTENGYAELTRIVKDIARRHARGRLVTVLEGGYDPEALARSVESHLRALME